MKRIITSLCIAFGLLAGAAPALAQLGTYGNEWIDYSQSYYKFKVAKDGIYRIPKSVLDAAGIPASTPGSQFRLFRDGQQLPLYTTTSGAFAAGDYIEFYGQKSDGKLDTELYGGLYKQANDRNSLFSDSAAYFLTFDTKGGQARFSAVSSTVPAGATPASWLWFTNGIYYNNVFAPGRTYASGHAFYSSRFDRAEGWINGWYSPASITANLSLPTPNAVPTAGVSARFSTSLLAISYNNLHHVRVLVNGQQLADSSYGIGDTKRFDLSMPASNLSATASIQFIPYNAGVGYDQYGVSFIEMTYPRNFDIGNTALFAFRLPATASRYLEFSGSFSSSSVLRLYDLSQQKWYSGDVSQNGKARFYVDAAISERSMVLYVDGSQAVSTIGALQQRQFTDYSQAARQGNYVIITHKDLMQPVQGRYFIDEYKAYRSSITGGGYQVTVADVTELYDQFAYGMDIHPLSIRHFLQYAYDNWQQKPRFVLLAGRGLLYHKYKNYLASPAQYGYPIVPTWGQPGSDADLVNFGPQASMKMAVGRLSAWNAQQIGTYLDKLKAYESGIQMAPLPTAGSELWKKEALHIAGASSASAQQNFLLPTLNLGAAIIRDTFMGARVTTIAKTSSDPTSNVASAQVDSMINNGIGLITFHGHASSSGFDYNLNDPQQYNSSPRFPVFLGLGCDVAQIFELSTNKTISEQYIDAPTGGSINMIAADNLGFTNFHQDYLVAFYNQVSRKAYGSTVGEQFMGAYNTIYNNDPGNDFFFVHLESMLLQGDPAVRMFAAPKPDYHIAAEGLATLPANVTTTLDSFRLRITSYNLGRALRDTVMVKVEHINPAQASSVVSVYPVVNLFHSDTAFVWVPVNKLADLGLNKLRVTIDPDGLFDEMSEANNSATLELFIYSDNLIPVQPHPFAIVSEQGITLKASTLNPFRPVGRYRMEIDTTELFNSPQLRQTTITSPSGVIKWQPPVSYQDSVVYYWRTAYDSAVHGNYQWSHSSFIYLAAGSPGWNQSHYFQFDRNNYDGLRLESNRRFGFNESFVKVTGLNKIMYNNNDVDFCKVMVNDIDRQRSTCNFNGTLHIMVFDTATGQPWANTTPSFAGALPANCNVSPTRGKFSFEYPLSNAAYREAARRFLDSIPDGYYIMVRNAIWSPLYVASYAASWQNDTLAYGSGNSLYHALKRVGFQQIDSFDSKRAFMFMAKKGSNTYPVYQAFAAPESQEVLEESFIIPTTGTSGRMLSTTIGPALGWTSLSWKSYDPAGLDINDSSRVQVIGIDTAENETVLFAAASRQQTLSGIDAAAYPYLRLQWHSLDTITRTSSQLAYWRVLYEPAPEAALNPAAAFSFTDSVHVGQMINFSVAIEELSNKPMDSMLVRYRLLDARGVSHHIGSQRYRKLQGLDTLMASISFDPAPYPGTNVLFVEANPDEDQPEQYHPNNLGYLPFKVIADQSNPLLDVTFDGVHILDRDIVSARPFIQVMLKDENRYLALDDTALLRVSVRHPGDPLNTRREVRFDGATCRFIPATAGGNGNTARIEYRPTFTEDGIYELFVTGRDKSGNTAGGKATDYQISFEVINKTTITHVLNYPNPFSTSTAFLFTLTGSRVPSQFKIQILTVTGKVVREITREELGPIHIGRNITEYKWDGRDQYGQLLGNGVYLYRVVTSMDGQDVEHRASNRVDAFFKNGYGKMYLMR